jgi:hypothetical protein
MIKLDRTTKHVLVKDIYLTDISPLPPTPTRQRSSKLVATFTASVSTMSC